MDTLRKPVLKLGSDALEIDIAPSRNGPTYGYAALSGADGQSLCLLYPHSLTIDNRARRG